MDFIKYTHPLLYKIKNAKLSKYPYPHSEIEDLLDYEIIEQIDKNFPDFNAFNKNSDTNNVQIDSKKKNDEHQYDFRHILTLTDPKDLNKIETEKKIFWEGLTKFLCSSDIIRGLLSFYSPYVEKRFGENLVNKKFKPSIMLLHDKAKYFLGPHTDHIKKVLTILIYLSDENFSDKNSKFGTSIYLPKDQNFICEKGRHYTHQDFHRLHTCRFKVNNSFSFFRTNNSFHGVEPVPVSPQERKLIQYSIFEI